MLVCCCLPDPSVPAYGCPMQRNRSLRFFTHGPAAEVRLFFLAVFCVGLMIADSQTHYLEPVRKVVSVMLYPFQKTAMWPRDAVTQVHDWSNAITIAKQESAAVQRQ